MSFNAMAWAARQKLPCTQKIVLLMLADRHNKDSGQCNPSHEVLAEDCGLTRRSVMDQIVKLATVGYIRIIHRTKAKLKLPNQYMLILGFGEQEVVNDVYIEEPGIAQEVVNVVHQVVNDVPKGSEPVAHKPVIEPVIEPVKKNTRAEALPIPDGVSVQVWTDFLQVRKDKRAHLSATALSIIQKEADKAGYTLEKALSTCCARGWQSFEAGWVSKPAAMTASNRPQAESFAERDARIGRERWELMTGRQWPADELPGAAKAAPMFIDVAATEVKRLSK